MKFIITLASSLILVGSGVSAHAAGAEGNMDRAHQMNRNSHAAHKVLAAARRMAKESDYIGKAVVNFRGETLGEVIDLAIDGAQGRVIYAVLGSGGLFGIGRTVHAIPLRAFSKVAAEDELVLDVPKARLDSQPGFDDDHWPAKANRRLIDRPVSSTSTLRRPGPQTPAVAKPGDKGVR